MFLNNPSLIQHHNHLHPLRVDRRRSNQLLKLLVKTSGHVLRHILTGGHVGEPRQQVNVFRLDNVTAVTVGPQPESGQQAVQQSNQRCVNSRTVARKRRKTNVQKYTNIWLQVRQDEVVIMLTSVT